VSFKLGIFCLLFSGALLQAKNTSNDFGCFQKDQGELGTCHAFALTCPIENYETLKTKGKESYKVSSNWMVFVSMLDQLCVDDNSLVNPLYGWHTEKNFDRLKQMGYCKEEEYLAYQPIFDPWMIAKQNNEKLSSISARSSVGALWNSKDFDIGVVQPELEPIFKSQFGISSQDAKSLYCTPGNFDSELEKFKQEGKVDPAFYKCASAAKQKSKEFSQDCSKKNLDLPPDPKERFKVLAKEIQEGSHVLAAVYSDQLWPGTGHTLHAIDLVGTAAGYEGGDGNRVKVYNSWGGKNNSAIPSERLGAIKSSFSVSCGDVYKQDVDERFLPPSMLYKFKEDAVPSDLGRDLLHKFKDKPVDPAHREKMRKLQEL